MHKREFLKSGALLATAAALVPVLGTDFVLAKPAEFTLPTLPYPAGALEPFIDKQTMELHHDKHHAAYVTKLNDALKGKPEAGMDLMALNRQVKGQPDAVRNNAGGHFNHSLFWQMMRPAQEKNMPQGKLAERINGRFQSFPNFQVKFKEAALGRFGSGWAWLILTPLGELEISSTPNQDNPTMNLEGIKPGIPLLGLDVWEHAYYLKYQNRRPEYVDAFWNLVNWEYAQTMLASVSK
jgi:Fe-Mn family superoxide dismutase